jgi:hypothetical protein
LTRLSDSLRNRSWYFAALRVSHFRDQVFDCLDSGTERGDDGLAQAHDTFLAAEGEGFACDEEDALARPTERGDETSTVGSSSCVRHVIGKKLGNFDRNGQAHCEVFLPK